jgi:hypothetical protein
MLVAQARAQDTGVPAAHDTTSGTSLNVDSLRRQYLLPVPAFERMMGEETARSAPGTSSGSPSAFGPNFDDAFIGLGYQRHVRRGTYSDASVTAGFGLGDAARWVGLEVDAVSWSTWRGGMGRRLSFGFKLHRLLPNNAGIAIGWENAITTGEGSDGGSSKYIVASKVFSRTKSVKQPVSTMTISVGVGDGRFRFENDVREHTKHVNLFGSIGVRVIDPASVFADWTGQDLTLGMSLVPFASIPFSITPAFADVTRTANDRPRFICSAGLAFKISSLFHGF